MLNTERIIHIQLCSNRYQTCGDFIYRYYKARFQIEFLFRDASNTGLNQCQARSENKLNFHFNASLTAVSLSKTDSIFKEPLTNEVFSMVI